MIQGKDKPTYAPNRDDGDMCIVLNAKDICVTGRKLTDKVYHWHTGQVPYLLILLMMRITIYMYTYIYYVCVCKEWLPYRI